MTTQAISLPFSAGQLPAAFAAAGITAQSASKFASNVGAAFPVISIKGKVFRIRHDGQEIPLLDPKTRHPVQSFEVVIVEGNEHLSKTYYAKGYVDGSSDQPDCWSEDGVHPLAPNPVNSVCATCPMNAFGSRTSADRPDSKAKACADTRKIAVVPAWDIPNERFGGPMLLRVPADSLKGLAEVGRLLASQGIPVQAVVIALSFDFNVAHPKLVFRPIRALTEVEGQQVVQVMNLPQTKVVLAADQVGLPAPAAQSGAIPADQPIQQAAPVQQAAPPVQQQAPAPQQAAPAAFGPPPATQYAEPAAQAAPQQAAPAAFGPPPAQAAPSNVVPLQQAAPPQAAPQQAAPQQAAPAAFGPPPAAPQQAAQAAPAAGIPQRQPLQAAPPSQQPADEAPVDMSGLLGSVDQLLGT